MAGIKGNRKDKIRTPHLQDLLELDKQLYELLGGPEEPSDEAIEALIKQGASPDARIGESTERVLHRAAYRGYVHAIRTLVRLKAEINRQEINRDAPLNAAAGRGHSEAVRVLLELGANPCTVGYNGTVLQDACLALDDKSVALLLQTKAKEQVNEGDPAPLLQALIALAHESNESDEAKQAAGPTIVRLLLEAGGDIQKGSCYIGTPLSRALAMKSDVYMKLLLAFHPECLDEALYWAADANKLDRVQWLLEQGADMHYRHPQIDHKGVLHAVAMSSEDVEMKDWTQTIRTLSAWGADVNAKDDDGYNAYTRLLYSGGIGDVQLALLDLGSRLPPDYEDHPSALYRYEQAKARFDETIGSDAPNVRELHAHDLILFANIGLLSQALKPSLWQGHAAHLSELLKKLPPALVCEVMVLPGIAEMVKQPQPVVSDWSHEPLAQTQHTVRSA